MWLDKVCINQTDITSALACLPVFLAGCENILVLAGATYASRLWCCVELFVHYQITLRDGQRVAPLILELAPNAASWEDFDASTCDCFDPADKDRFFSVIHSFPGSVHAFNVYIKQMTRNFYAPSRQPIVDISGAVNSAPLEVCTGRMGCSTQAANTIGACDRLPPSGMDI